MAPVAILILTVIVIALGVEVWLQGSFNYVFNCSIFGAVCVFLATLVMKLIGATDLDIGSAYAAGSISYFLTFLLLQRISVRFISARGEDASQIWDTGTRLGGLFLGTLAWPLFAPLALFGLQSHLRKRHSASL